MNPLTAWRLLNDFEYLREGDVIIQNAANSAVGLSVMQFAKKLGITCVNLVRNEDRLNDLKSFGAEEVWLDNEDVPQRIPSLLKIKVVRWPSIQWEEEVPLDWPSVSEREGYILHLEQWSLSQFVFQHGT